MNTAFIYMDQFWRVDQLQTYIKVTKTKKFAWKTLHGGCINRQLDEAWDSLLEDALDILFFEKKTSDLVDTGGITCDKIHQSKKLLMFLFFL